MGRQPRVLKFKARFADVWSQYKNPNDKLPTCAEAMFFFNTVTYEGSAQITDAMLKESKAAFNKSVDDLSNEELNVAALNKEKYITDFDTSFFMREPPILSFKYGGNYMMSMYCKITELSIEVLRMNPFTGLPMEMDVDIALTEHIALPTTVVGEK